MDKFFKIPFASAGDVTAIPDALDGAGNVSFTQGYGPDYQRPKLDPLCKNIERDKANWLYGALTEELGLLQRHGAPDFITSALNGGSPHEYDIGDYVRYTDGGNTRVYVSRVAANTDLPTVAASWRMVRDGIPTTVAGGTASALTADFSPDLLSPQDGEIFLLKHTAANPGAATLAVDGEPPLAIVKGNNLPLIATDIPGADSWGLYVLDASLAKYVLLNPATGLVVVRGVPTGMYGSFPATAAPSGWVKRNGALLSRVTYADLWAFAQASGNLAASDGAWTKGQFSPGDGATTFRIPDGRGYFERNWDDGAGIDAGRSIGTVQAGNVGAHSHGIEGLLDVTYGGGASARLAPGSASVAANTISNPTGEVRPVNVASLACIAI